MDLKLKNRSLTNFDGNSVLVEANSLRNSGRDVRIKSIDLSNNLIATLSNAHRLTSVVQLSLANNKLTSLCDLPPNLERLNLSNNFLTDLSVLAPLNRLVSLSAANNEITAAGLAALPSSLETLNLQNNKIASLEWASGCRNVLKISLQDNTVRRLNELAHFKYAGKLRHVSLNGNPVSMLEKFIMVLSDCVPKLSTVDGVPLSQATANRVFRVNEERSRADSEARNRLHSAIVSRQPRREDDLALARAESTAKELERLLAAEEAAVESEQRKNQQLQQQMRRLEGVLQSQLSDLERIRDANQMSSATCESLETTNFDLEGTFEGYRAAKSAIRASTLS